MENEKIKEWYDNADLITSIIIGVVVVLILLSQSFAIQNQVSPINILRSILNHNAFYLFALVYFILIKCDLGKRNFNIINIIFIGLHGLSLIASLFTIFQSFTLLSIASFCLNFIVFVYMVYTFLKQTRLWKDFNLNSIPFDEIENDWYFYGICGVSLFILLINLINSNNFYGVVISILGTSYTLLFARYIYLYKSYEDSKLIKKSKRGRKPKKEVNK